MLFDERNFHPEKQARIREVVNGWFETPVTLASSSSYRADVLKSIGFQQVDSFPMPDEIETQVMLQLGGETLTEEISFDEPHDTPQLVCGVAKAKVEYVLEHGHASDNEIICAADSMPRFTRLRFNKDGECVGASAEHLKKPSSEEEVHKNLVSMFDSIIEVARYMKKGLGEQLDVLTKQEQFEKGIQLTGVVAKAMYIELGTGMAVRLPHSSTIDTLYSAIYLLPAILLDIVEGRESMTTQDLADAVIFKMKQSGKPMTKIAGGIDWSDAGVRMVLDANDQLAYTIAPEKGVYLGMPAQALDMFLRDKASQKIS